MSKALSELTSLVTASMSGPSVTPVTPAKEEKKKTLSTMDEKWAVLAAVEKTLNKQFSGTALVRLGSKVGQIVPSIGGDIPTFDFGVIGIGGIPRGRIIEWYGDTSGGKTTLALHYVAKEQARGGICAYIDAEYALDPSYMATLGVDVDKLVVAQPDSLEQAMETAEALVESGAVTLIVVDSVAALTPQAELNGESGDVFMGLQARLMGQSMRKLRGKCSEQGVSIIFINQLRTNLGQTYGNPNVTPGGKALKFFSSVRVEISRVGGDGGKIQSGDVLLGHKIRLRCTKNKMAAPAKVTEITLIYGKGIDTFADFIEYAVTIGAIQKAGAWYNFGAEKLGQGLTNAIERVRVDNKMFEAIKKEVEKAQAAQREADKQ